MPSLIQQKHKFFLKRFDRTGQAFILNRDVTMFIKKQNGFVFPCQLFIKFHYSHNLHYTFLAIVKPLYQMAPFSDGVSHHLNNLHFLIVDSEPEGTIIEMSESWLKLIQSKGLKAEELTTDS